MRRREFIGGIGAAMLPLAARAQQVPKIGVLYSGSLDLFQADLAALRQGLAESGAARGANVVFEVRSAEGDFSRLASLAEDLASRGVAVIVSASNAASAVAAKASARMVPIVFYMGADPVALGIVDSLSRPGGNITGVTVLAGELTGKRIELLHELVPTANRLAYLVNAANPAFTDDALSKHIETARGLGMQLSIVKASNSGEIDDAFASLDRNNVHGLVVGADTFLQSQRDRIVSLAARRSIVGVYPGYEYVAIGGLMSYSGDFGDAYRRVGAYVARILNGEDPKNLPVQQATNFRLAINIKTARQAGIEIPPALLARADTVIE
jgi:putative tryptophan/tyrosine transport system substrate-binding protein